MKVISVSGGRVSLSMRDVDQATGRDLLPGARMAAEGVNPTGPASGPAAPGGGLRGLSGVSVRALAAVMHSAVGAGKVIVVIVSRAASSQLLRVGRAGRRQFARLGQVVPEWQGLHLSSCGCQHALISKVMACRRLLRTPRWWARRGAPASG